MLQQLVTFCLPKGWMVQSCPELEHVRESREGQLPQQPW